MKISNKRVLAAVMAVAVGAPLSASLGATTLSAGDVIITFYRADSPDSVSFVPLVALESGTVIKFTDIGSNNTAGTSWRSLSETNVWTYTAASNIAAGTTIDVPGISGGIGDTGDQVFAFQGAGFDGTDASPSPGTLLYGVNIADTNWQSSGGISDSTSYLPTALSSANFDGSNDNGRYKPGSTHSGSKATILATVNTSGNWNQDDNSSGSNVQAADATPFVIQNNTQITGSAISFNRRYLGQTPTITLPLSKTGGDNTLFTATSGSTGLTATADGYIDFGTQTENVSLQLVNNANGSGATGSKSFTVTVDNTANGTAGAGQGSADADDAITVTATIVSQRSVTQTGGAVSLGNWLVGKTVTGTANLGTSGADTDRTRVTVASTAVANGDGISVVSGSDANDAVYNAAADTGTRTFGGSFSTSGSKSGSVGLAVTGEGLTGEGAYSNATVSYTAAAYDAANITGTASGMRAPGQTIAYSNQSGAFRADATVTTFTLTQGDNGTWTLPGTLANGAVIAPGGGVTGTATFNAANLLNGATSTGSVAVTLTNSKSGGLGGAVVGDAGSYSYTLSTSVSGNTSAVASSGASNLNSYIGGNAQTAAITASGSYAGISSTTVAGGNTVGTTAMFLGGANATGSAETIGMNWRDRSDLENGVNPQSAPLPATVLFLGSDVVRITGMAKSGGASNDDRTETDIYVLSVTYDPALLPGGPTAEAGLAAGQNLYLAWLDAGVNGADSSDFWRNAVVGNFGGLSVGGGWAGVGAFSDAGVAGLGDDLGLWGVNTLDHSVWAVLNHNSDFAAVPSSPAEVPEPTSLLVCAAGSLMLLRRPTRRIAR
ncbi:MAG: hypothetical protein K8S99_11835 [Planctomycetes bacterium]|nr:hypothetical protein [Planctomycetota bacterium]